jgi:hypothetical protein
MSRSRPSIFEDDGIDLSRFAPKNATEKPVPADTVRRVSEEAGFPSRAPQPVQERPLRKSFTKTGRTELLNARISPRAHARFHDIVEAERLRYEAGELSHRVTLGEVVERALAALEREILTKL